MDTMNDFTKRTNAALRTNPNTFAYPESADVAINTHGSDWYWAVCALMATAFLTVATLSFFVPRKDRIFHYITATLLLTASISYFTMASNLGYAAIGVEFHRTSPETMGLTRQVFYVRYIDWVITTPLLLLDILLTAGVPWTIILWTLFLDEVMIITGLVGALVASSYKWGYFVFALISLFGVAYNVLWTARRFSHRIGGRAYKTFLLVGCWTLFLWFLYPISWGLSEGGNRIGAVGEAVFYGVLDILSKVVFTIFLLIGHAGIDPATLGVAIRDYDEELYGEKTHPQQGSSAVANTSAHAGVNEPSHIGQQGPGTGSGLEGQSQAYASTANASGMPQHAPPAR